MTERFFGDALVSWMYSDLREQAPGLFRALTSRRISGLLAAINYDLPFTPSMSGVQRFLKDSGIDLSECLAPPGSMKTMRALFERQIPYWRCRPMPEMDAVVSPADARALVGSFQKTSALFIKEKFFHFQELIGENRPEWIEAFRDGDFAIFRLTPDKYHYNHAPVSGEVVAFYEIPGAYHSCNPQAVLEIATPYSKNRRVVTIIQTDTPGGDCVGLVAMIEIVALMIGDITQRYSETGYESPRSVTPGMFIKKGQPKSLYRPGSSTDVLIFQPGRVRFAEDLLTNMSRQDVISRFSQGFRQPLVETDIQARSLLAHRRSKP